MQDSHEYLEKKKHFNTLITIYGRHAVEEALMDPAIEAVTLHLSLSNKPAPILDAIEKMALTKGASIKRHEKTALSRISKNSQQDQGVALDIRSSNYISLETFIATAPHQAHIIALDGLTNPQNLGMIIRSVAASNITALLLPKKGCVQISPLVIKASAGALFKAKILYCDDLKSGLETLHNASFQSFILSSHASSSLFEHTPPARGVYILGNETKGVSGPIETHSMHKLAIPMRHGVESLNVAVTAALIAFTVAR